MTKPKPEEILWQVVAERRGLPPEAVGPKWIQPAAEEFAKVINLMVAAGREKTYRHAYAVPCLPVAAPSFLGAN